MFAIFVVIVEMILSHRSRRVSNLRKKSPDGHCVTGAFLYWNQWAGLFGHKGIESLGFRGHLTLDFPALKSLVIRIVFCVKSRFCQYNILKMSKVVPFSIIICQP